MGTSGCELLKVKNYYIIFTLNFIFIIDNKRMIAVVLLLIIKLLIYLKIMKKISPIGKELMFIGMMIPI